MSRTTAAALLIFLTVVVPAYAQSAAVPSVYPPSPYSLLRDEENWTFLANRALRQDFWDPIKHVPLRSESDWYLSVGGEIRYAFEQVANDNWGAQPYVNRFLLQRYMMHTDWHLGQWSRVFVQLKSGLESFRIGGARPIDEKQLDVEAAFVELGTSAGKKWAVLRIGRQEVNYGSGRLVSVREGPNVRQSFDGIKIRSRIDAWHVDAFAVRPDLDKFHFFDNVPNHQTAFWGVYTTRPWRRGLTFDAYYLGLDRASATFNRGTARERRHSFGTRLSRPVAVRKPGLDFDYEGVWQIGSFGLNGIRAWTIASDTGYCLPGWRLDPRFSVKADVSSGDNPQKSALGTFNALFPTGNYFGVFSDTGPGPVNFIDVHPRTQVQFPRGVSLSLDVVVHWRESLRDGLYSVPGVLLVSSGTSSARFVGYRPGIESRWQIDRHLYVQADYGIFYPGSFLKQETPGRDLNYLHWSAGYKF